MNVVIEQAGKSFGAVQALKAVSLHIQSGELFFLLGPSGCGKTTLLRVLAGLETLDSGRILFDGTDVAGVAPHKRNAAMVFQGYALWPHMSVSQNVAFGLETQPLSKAERKAKVAAALEHVQIRDLAQRKPHELSGGQQQRVALARTLVVEPRCLLLDEPLANLDAKLRHDMRAEIRRICKDSGLTAVYVTHDRKEALSMADRVAVLDAGVLLQTGTPRQVYRRPCNTFVASFIGETNFLPAKVLQNTAGHVVLDTALGQLRASPDEQGLQPGQDVTVCLRPEVLQLTATDGEREQVNRFTAELLESAYLGEAAEYQLEAAQGLKLKAYRLNPRVELECSGGLSVSVAPEDVMVIAEENAQT